MKIIAFRQKNGQWIKETREVNRLKHYWYSLRVVLRYYRDKWREL